MPALKNKRHEAFCLEYRKNGFNGKQAYKTVYRAKNDRTCEVSAERLLSNVEVQSRLEELGEKDTLRYGIDMEKLVNDLKDINEIGRKQIAYYDKEGNEVATKPTDLNASLKAIDTLIKIAGEYAPTKTENKTEVIEKPDLSKLSKKDLESLEKTLTKI
jgi:hypothetical protein